MKAETPGSTPGVGESALAAWFAFLAICVIFFAGGIFRLGDGQLYDPDAYMHLARAQLLWDGWGWWDPIFPRINPPEGHIQHWTRPLDSLLLFGGALGAPFVGFETALYWWGALLSPLLMLGALCLLIWGARPLLGERRQVLTGLLFACQAAILVTFAPGRADHNALLMICFLAGLGLTVRMICAPGAIRPAGLAGAVGAFGLWIGVEALTFIAPALLILGLHYLCAERRQAAGIAALTAALALASALFLFVERGPARFGVTEYDQASSAHLILFALIAAAWGAMAWAGRRWRLDGTPLKRAVLIAAAGLPALALLYLFAPGFIDSPLAAVDGLYEQVRLSKLRELQPLFASNSEGFSWNGYVARPILWFGLALLAWPYLILRLVRSSGTPFWLWMAVALNAAIFSAMAAMQIRWLPYAVASLALPYAALLCELLDRLPRLGEKSLKAKLLVTLFAAWWIAPTVLASSFNVSAKVVPPIVGGAAFNGTCDYAALGRYLSAPDGLGAAPLKVLIFTDHGSELLYRTPHSVLSMPNHRLQPGFSESYAIFAALDHAAAVMRIKANAIDLVVVCGDDLNARGFYRPVGAGSDPEPMTLFYRLQTRPAPAGLNEIRLPPEMAPLRLFQPAP